MTGLRLNNILCELRILHAGFPIMKLRAYGEGRAEVLPSFLSEVSTSAGLTVLPAKAGGRVAWDKQINPNGLAGAAVRSPTLGSDPCCRGNDDIALIGAVLHAFVPLMFRRPARPLFERVKAASKLPRTQASGRATASLSVHQSDTRWAKPRYAQPTQTSASRTVCFAHKHKGRPDHGPGAPLLRRPKGGRRR